MATIYVTDREGKEHVLEVATRAQHHGTLREIDDGVEALCGGMCSCATCHVYIDPEWAPRLSERGDDELELLEDTECFKGQESRLSCQITVTAELDGMRIVVAPEE